MCVGWSVDLGVCGGLSVPVLLGRMVRGLVWARSGCLSVSWWGCGGHHIYGGRLRLLERVLRVVRVLSTVPPEWVLLSCPGMVPAPPTRMPQVLSSLPLFEVFLMAMSTGPFQPRSRRHS